ncbi:hypothetical protein [Ralstonia phage p2106]|uniref:HNH nuclease domain-containing protein n=1 Tax=Ralstonia phage p2106 TaxID=2998497 RepID=A0AAE9VJX0_9CAUD|nr:hypothetical protein [Ralstonia phage p2106]
MTPCITTGGYHNKDGYSIFRLGATVVKGHRVSYCVRHCCSLESIKGLVIRHKCDNPACVNPDHLEVGTHADNVADRQKRKRQAVKVPHEALESIRSRYASGERQSVLAAEFGINQSQVSLIVNYKNRRSTCASQ